MSKFRTKVIQLTDEEVKRRLLQEKINDIYIIAHGETILYPLSKQKIDTIFDSMHNGDAFVTIERVGE